MDNKLSELSKPVAWTWHAFGRQHITTEESDHEDLIADGDETHPLYSQEYVSALLAENEEKEKLLISNAIEYEISATDLLAELEAKDKRIAELELDELAMRASSRAVHEAQENHINQQQDRIDSLEKTNAGLGRGLAAAEKRLATPVRLPPLMNGELCGKYGAKYGAAANAHNNAITACSIAICGAGFKSEVTAPKCVGDEQ